MASVLLYQDCNERRGEASEKTELVSTAEEPCLCFGVYEK
jgi:hypothetical protein